MPRSIVLLLAVVLAVGTAAVPATAQRDPGNVLVSEGYALPRDHQYERYDVASGTYARVDVNQVPALIKQKAWIYDRTAQAWVYRPQQGLNATYSAQSSAGAVATGTLSLPRDHQYERYDPAGGTYSRVDAGQVPALIEQKAWIYDRTDQAWVYRPQQGLDPRYAAGSTQGQGRWAGPNRGNGRWDRGQERWERVSGVVQNVSANQMTVRTDDGQVVTVDIAEARQHSTRQLTVGERVSAIGFYTAPNQLTARAVRDFRGGPAPAKGDGDWERIHGVVQSVQGTTLRFRADDGRMLTVDMSKVGSNIRQALTQGEPVTVIGYEWTGANQLRAEYIQQDSSDPARQPSASPR